MPEAPNGLVVTLFHRLAEAGVEVCHWKSNRCLDDALAGVGDLDLLVAPGQRHAFAAVLAELGFCRTRSPWYDRQRSISHWYGASSADETIIHVHAYEELVLGGGLLKNHRLPIERAVLDHSRVSGPVQIPEPYVDRVLLVIRKLIESASVAEAILLRRESDAVLSELRWLNAEADDRRARVFVEDHLPSVDANLLARGADSLAARRRLRSAMVGWRIRRQLRTCAHRSFVRAEVEATARGIALLAARLRRSGGRERLASGGPVVAFIGPDASGKSSALAATRDWLGPHIAVRTVHAGKPPPTPLTALPRLLLPLLRRLRPADRLNAAEEIGERAASSQPPSVVYALRSVMVTLEQRRLLVRAHRRASRGEVVLSDRYPSFAAGGTDGPRLPATTTGRRLVDLIARVEHRLYRSIPPPDVVLRLHVPLDVAIARNRERGGDPEPYIRARHAIIERWQWPGAPVVIVENSGEPEVARRAIRDAVWRLL